MTEVLTQNPDLTQLGDDSQSQQSILSPLPESPPKVKPWGRLMPCSTEGSIVPLLPRPPNEAKTPPSHDNNTASALQIMMDHVKTSDVFNEYTLGRSGKCDVRALKPVPADNKKLQARQEWAYGMISNRHCKIYCCLDPTVASSHDTIAAKLAAMHVFVEDCSGNGTLINQTTLLRKGEKRRLHSGDEITLVNKLTLKKKIRSDTELQALLQQHAYVFVNTCAPATALKPTSLLAEVTGRTNAAAAAATTTTATSSGKRKPAVNVRATKPHHRARSPSQSPVVPRASLNGTHNHNINSSTSKDFSFQPPQPVIRRSSVSSSQSTSNQSNSNFANNNTSTGGNRRISPRRQKPRRVQEDYDIRDVLGHGTVGEVRRAIHRQSGQERAVKIIAAARNRGQQEAELQVEAEILQKLDHPYVVKMIDVYVSPAAVFLVMELMPGGDLFDRIVAKGKYTETEARRVFRRILNAVYYLHQNMNVVHRDLKPENILLTGTASDIDIALTDFGLAKADGGNLKTFCGTPAYFAPEVLRRRHTVKGTGRYGKPADLWSLGVVLYVLLTGMPPFDDSSCGYEEGQIEFPSEVPEKARDLVLQLLQPDPLKRASVVQACEHAWVLQEDGDTHTHPLDDPKWMGRPKREEEDEPKKKTNDTEVAALEEKPAAKPRPADEKPAGSSSAVTELPESELALTEGTEKEEPSDGTGLHSTTPPPPSSAQAGSVASAIVPQTDRAAAAFPLPPVFGEREPKVQSQDTTTVQRVSAINFSFRHPTPRMSKDPSPSPSQHRRPLSPISANDDVGVGAADAAKTLPLGASSLSSTHAGDLQESKSDDKRSSIDGGGGGGVDVSSTTAITPGASNVRQAEPTEQEPLVNATTAAPCDNNDGLELSDDEILSRFSENTDSISSFSTAAASTTADAVEKGSGDSKAKTDRRRRRQS